MMNHGWTKGMPTIPGFYWIAIEPYSVPGIEHVRDDIEGNLLIFHGGEMRPIAELYGDADTVHWWGPMVPPEPPPGVSYDMPPELLDI
ncbi:MAG: hypothetical protein ACYTHK_19595 [Planctomycetota bacterium]|jgi:hypothetical protein